MTYHVQCNPNNGVINAGTINKQKNKWVNKTDVTKEALEAVRDHLLFIAKLNNLEEGAGYRWECQDEGKAIKLTVQVVQLGEEKTAESSADEVSESEKKYE